MLLIGYNRIAKKKFLCSRLGYSIVRESFTVDNIVGILCEGYDKSFAFIVRFNQSIISYHIDTTSKNTSIKLHCTRQNRSAAFPFS